MGFSEEGFDNPKYNPKKRTYSESDVFRFRHSEFLPGADASHIVCHHARRKKEQVGGASYQIALTCC